ncbi:MAG: SUF system NifU family Fe-S cluster assembly protein [Anaerolineales bacterium]|nr:SUF system NifU family Fe-S cluster assembly protein [Anaerolineales bacterium]
MDDLYRELIIERYKAPYYRGHLDPHDIFFEDDNPVCGDHIEVTLRLDGDDRVSAAAFDGHGCSISQASADLLVESVHGKTLDEVKALTKDDVIEMLGIDLGPVRLKCALLSLKVLKAGAYGLSVDEVSDDLVD